jgi:hypothetical protein
MQEDAADHFLIGALTVGPGISARTAKKTTPATTAMWQPDTWQ